MQSYQPINGEIRKQVMPINHRSDGKLRQMSQQELVDFIYSHLRRGIRENKQIEIEGKLGRFYSKSTNRADIDTTAVKLHTIDTISHNQIVYMRPFEQFLAFDSLIYNKTYLEQVKYFDGIAESIEQKRSGEQQESEFSRHAQVSGILDQHTFNAVQNNIIVDFIFDDGSRLKVPLDAEKPIELDKKQRGQQGSNLDFVIGGYHYRVSAREEEEIHDRDLINKKLEQAQDGNFVGVRIKYRKAYEYLFMEFAFTRVLQFKSITKKMKLDVADQLEQMMFTDFCSEVAAHVLNRSKFKTVGVSFFQRAFDLQFNTHTKFEAELELKNVKKYFAPYLATSDVEFSEESQQQIQSHIRSFIRNLISLNSISDFFGQYYLQTIKAPSQLEHSKNKPIQLTAFKPNILGQYLESLHPL